MVLYIILKANCMLCWRVVDMLRRWCCLSCISWPPFERWSITSLMGKSALNISRNQTIVVIFSNNELSMHRKRLKTHRFRYSKNNFIFLMSLILTNSFFSTPIAVESSRASCVGYWNSHSVCRDFSSILANEKKIVFSIHLFHSKFIDCRCRNLRQYWSVL